MSAKTNLSSAQEAAILGTPYIQDARIPGRSSTHAVLVRHGLAKWVYFVGKRSAILTTEGLKVYRELKAAQDAKQTPAPKEVPPKMDQVHALLTDRPQALANGTELLTSAKEAARTLLNRKVREGVMSRSEANKFLAVSVPYATKMLGEWRREGRSAEWITDTFQAKRADAERAGLLANNRVLERAAKGRLMSAELFLAVWAGMQEDLGRYRDTLREEARQIAREIVEDLAADDPEAPAEEPTETFRVLVEQHHEKGGRIGAGTRVVEARDKAEAAELAVTQSVAHAKEKNARSRAEMARMGADWSWNLSSENPDHYKVINVRRAPKKVTR